MNIPRRSVGVALAFLIGTFETPAFGADDGYRIGDRLAIQDTVLHAYAYAYDSKDCVKWANLFSPDGVFEVPGEKVTGRDAILQWCAARQKGPLANTRTRHNVCYVVVAQPTETVAQVRAYVLI